VLIDAFADPAFCVSLVHCLAANSAVPFAGGELRFESTGEVPLSAIPGQSVNHVGSEPTNTSVILDDRLFLKAYRRVESGPNPDVEMTRYLTRAGFHGVAALGGSITHVTDTTAVVAAVFACVQHQGDAWTYALNHLERFANTMFSQDAEAAEAPHALFTAQMHTLGRRVGELHRVLSTAKDDENFAAEPLTSADLSRWYSAIHFDADTMLRSLRGQGSKLPSATSTAAAQLLESADRLLARIRELCSELPGGLKTRHHGNLHLGKVLLIADDLLITGFEGDASLPLDERRIKDSPLRDVATILRSFDYARATALDRAVTGRPDLRDRLEPALADWQRLATNSFLKGYRRAAGEASFLPPDELALARVLRLFQIARALRELRNELVHRPAWIEVPIHALLALMAATEQ
jgi:maltose alpha-D-glucosyltransferase/alpha-amylase